MLLGWEAISNVNPHVYIDTMGYAFTYLIVRLFTNAKIACYVHYPTISTDMLQVVKNQERTFNNDNQIAGSILKTYAKLIYYHTFAAMYNFVGSRSELVMVNSTWTLNHILHLWRLPRLTHTVYPPCNTTELQSIPLGQREKCIISIGQFR
jgi:alpha-1,2-mannosyltransferase